MLYDNIYNPFFFQFAQVVFGMMLTSVSYFFSVKNLTSYFMPVLSVKPENLICAATMKFNCGTNEHN